MSRAKQYDEDRRVLQGLWSTFDFTDFCWRDLKIEGFPDLAGVADLSLAVPVEPLALVTEHNDEPGEIARVASILAGWDINIAGVIVRRNRLHGRCILVTLVDSFVRREAITELKMTLLRPELWNWRMRNDIDLIGFPQGWRPEGLAIATAVEDRPGQIAKVARVFSYHGLNSSGFLVFRSKSKRVGNGGPSLQVNLIDGRPWGDHDNLSTELVADLNSALGNQRQKYLPVPLEGMTDKLPSAID